MSAEQFNNPMSTKPRVLVVDDELPNIELYETILSDEFDVASAENGQRALELVEEFRPDVVLLDIVLPDMSGLEVCRTLRENSRHRLLKVLFVSGKKSLEERLEGYGVGADDYITKPVDIDELIAKVRVYSRLRKVEEVDVYKNNFMSLISHETITPLNAILGFSDLLLQSDIPEDEIGYVQQIKNSGRCLHEKIKKILLLNEIYNTDNNFIPERVNIYNVITHSISAHLADAEARNQNLISDLFEEQKSMVVTSEQLSFKIIGYVIDNAIAYSPDGTDIVVSSYLEGGTYYVTIADKGPGMNKKQISAINEVFNCDDLLHHNSGLGMSLAMTRAVMEKFGGSMSIEKNDESGTVVKLSYISSNP